MRTFGKAGRALRTCFELGFLAALAIVNGCASESLEDAVDESAQADDSAIGEAMDELARSVPVGVYKCTLAGGLIMGSIVAFPGPHGNTTVAIYGAELAGSSSIFCIGSPPYRTCPECQDIRIDLGSPFAR
jgi:hypothetical protein